jgi:hypothetical protein
MTLHEAIQEVLRANHNAWMTAAEVARAIDRRRLYIRGDGASPPSSQISARINRYPHLFEVDRSQSPRRFRLS